MNDREPWFRSSRVCGQHPHVYDHWRCCLPRFHRGPHRFNNYTWRRGAVAWGTLRYGLRSVRLWIGKRLGIVRPWRVAINRTHTTYAPIKSFPWLAERDASSHSQTGGEA